MDNKATAKRLEALAAMIDSGASLRGKVIPPDRLYEFIDVAMVQTPQAVAEAIQAMDAAPLRADAKTALAGIKRAASDVARMYELSPDGRRTKTMLDYAREQWGQAFDMYYKTILDEADHLAAGTSPATTQAASEADNQPFIPTKRQAELLGILRDQGTMSLAGLEEAMNCNPRTIQKHAKGLEDPAKLIARNAGQYALTEKGRNFSL